MQRNMSCYTGLTKTNWIGSSCPKIQQQSIYLLRFASQGRRPCTNPDKIDWKSLSRNSAAMHLLCANPDKIDWTSLSRYPSAFDLLDSNHERILESVLSSHTAALD